MKRLIFSLAFTALLAGCATAASEQPDQAGTAHDPNSVYSDPTYPGPGVYGGIGIGTWGGRRGAGVGFGIGF